MIRKWVEQPLINVPDIFERLNAVNEFRNRFMVRTELRELLKRVYDIERLMGKIILGNANCRDLIALKNSFAQLPYIKNILKNSDALLNIRNYENLDTLEDIYDLIDRSIIDDPPISLKDGGLIKTGYSCEVDGYRNATTQGKNWIAALESTEREKTGIKNLKVGFNKVFGYFIEVTRSYFPLVPEAYIRKQTLSNCERFITQELKEIEDKILGAEEKVVELEYSLFIEVRNTIALEVKRIKTTASCIPRRRWRSSCTSWTTWACRWCATASGRTLWGTSSRAASGCLPGRTPSRRSRPSAGAGARPPATRASKTGAWSRWVSRSCWAATRAIRRCAAGTGRRGT
jgi:DNA mismatch repair protein MutS